MAPLQVPGAEDDTMAFEVMAKFFYHGHLDIKPPGQSKKSLIPEVVLVSEAVLFVNPDPLNNGNDNGDFEWILKATAAPELRLGNSL